MKKHFAVFSSDQLSKDGKRFSIGALENAIWQSSIYGVPSNLSHDIHRPVGWSYAKGLYFSPESVLTIGYFLIAQDKNDLTNINLARKAFFNNMMITSIDPHQSSFEKDLGKIYKTDNSGKWFYNSIVLYGYENILSETFPELKEKIEQEKAGLVDLDYLLQEFTYLSQGVFKKNNSNLCVIAHSYFRKSLSLYNNYHWIFLDQLISMRSNEDITLKIKLDNDFIGYSPSFITSHEFEYWWGPKFNDDITSIVPGLTQYKSETFEREYYNIDRTEFVWKNDGQLYTLELEEVRDEPAPTLNDIYGCRYVHSIFDKNKNGFDHFDGAIRAYSTDLMYERIDTKMTDMGRRSEYTKLFRIDGNLSLADWKSLVTNYMQGNPQIYEYFGIEKPSIKQILEPKTNSAKENYVPYSINANEGVRLYVSYHDRKEKQEHVREFDSHDILTLETGAVKVLDYFSVEVKKAFERNQTSIFFHEDCIFVIPEDYYFSIPNIFHNDENLQSILDKSLDVLIELFQKMVDEKRQEVISASLSWNLEDKLVRVSFMGHLLDLVSWLKSFNHIPVIRDEFISWLENQGSYIKQNGLVTSCPVLSEIICDDGIMFFKRRLVQKDATMNFEKEENLNQMELSFEAGREDLAEAVKKNEILYAPLIIAKKVICTKSNLEYHKSPYSIIYNETSQLMEDIEIASFYWTDKPRPLAIGD